MTGERRIGAREFATRVNAAAKLLAAGRSAGEARRNLASRFGVSERQARRYVERAMDGGVVEVPNEKTVLTVKIPVALVKQLRRFAVSGGETISAVVAQALRELFDRQGIGSRSGGSSH